jgi:hypothetical protein
LPNTHRCVFASGSAGGGFDETVEFVAGGNGIDVVEVTADVVTGIVVGADGGDDDGFGEVVLVTLEEAVDASDGVVEDELVLSGVRPEERCVSGDVEFRDDGPRRSSAIIAATTAATAKKLLRKENIS